MISLGVNLCLLIESTSYLSPKEQTIRIPVPFSISAELSAIMGTSYPNRGTFAFFLNRCVYLLSLGLIKTATHAPNNSGLVVAINKSLSPVLNFMVENKLFFSLSSSSAWAIAVWHSGHHIVGNSFK